jgi:hypothetical protein
VFPPENAARSVYQSSIAPASNDTPYDCIYNLRSISKALIECAITGAHPARSTFFVTNPIVRAMRDRARLPVVEIDRH